MMKVSQVLAAGLFGLMLTAQSASALPIASVIYGGQKYDLYAATDVTGLISWADANAAATTAGGCGRWRCLWRLWSMRGGECRALNCSRIGVPR